jgi:hypothetical protein
MKTIVSLCLLAGMMLPLSAIGQTSNEAHPQPPTTKLQNTKPKPSAYIVKAYAEEDDTGKRENRCCTTGPLHISYSDGTAIVIPLRDERGCFEKQAGFSYIKIASDRQTIGWAETCYVAASYPIEIILVVYRNGKIILRLEEGMIWHWEFMNGGKQAAIVWGTAHGSNCPTSWQLYDLRTRRKISEVLKYGIDEPCLKPDAPKWARQLKELGE